ncbi:MAG: hypothetical protein WC867_05105 [Candidatus Pacearchaeota archaeon]|jgi:hypothetical protein
MLPIFHFISGLILAILVYYGFEITIFQAFLIFFGAFFIDADHYFWYVYEKKDLSFKKARNYFMNSYFNRLKKPKVMVHEKRTMFFHTFEFLLFTLILSYFWKGFLFIWFGMILHSLLDIIEMSHDKTLKYRQFFLYNHFFKTKKIKNR